MRGSAHLPARDRNPPLPATSRPRHRGRHIRPAARSDNRAIRAVPAGRSLSALRPAARSRSARRHRRRSESARRRRRRRCRKPRREWRTSCGSEPSRKRQLAPSRSAAPRQRHRRSRRAGLAPSCDTGRRRWAPRSATHSINGTFVNGTRVGSAILTEGDVVTIGNVDLVFRDGHPGPSAARPRPAPAAWRCAGSATSSTTANNCSTTSR